MLSACQSWGVHPLEGSLIPVLPGVPIPDRWSRTENTADHDPGSLSAWWQHFGDATLSALIDRAVRESTDMAVAEAHLQQARALRDLAGANLSGYVNAGVVARSARPSYAATLNTYQAGLDASWEPDLFGARRQAWSAGEAELLARTLTLADTRVSISAEVALAYIQLRGVQQRQAAARSNQMRLHVLRDLAAPGAELDRERVRAALALSGADLAELTLSRAQLEHSLAALCGMAPQALALELAFHVPVPQAAYGLALSLPADTLRQRPDVRSAAARVEAAVARLGEADAARKPLVRLEGSIGLHGIGVGGAGGVLRGLLGSVSGVAFDGGAARAQVAAQQGSVLESYAYYRGAVLLALREVEDALVSVQAARDRLSALREAVDAAQSAAGLARRDYQSGERDMELALATQQVLFHSEDELARAAVADSAAYVRLYKALGGGWQPEH
nr:efflux transporter outer membrane subunit [Duganella radicis]